MFQETDHAASDIKEHREQECKNRIALLKNEKKQSGDQHAKCHDDIESTNVGITSGGNAVQSADHSFVCKETKRYDRKKSENHTEFRKNSNRNLPKKGSVTVIFLLKKYVQNVNVQ